MSGVPFQDESTGASPTGAELPRQPLIAVDVVPITCSNGGLQVATATRRYEPFAGHHALPGVLLGAGESLAAAARRALASKAGIGAPVWHTPEDLRPSWVRHLFQIGAFDGSNRDPRQHAISIAFVAIVGPEPATAERGITSPTPTWWDADTVPELPFDHGAIMAEALDQVRTRLWNDDAVTRALTGPWFSTPEAVHLTEQVTGTPTHQSNLRRALAANPLLRSTPAPDTGKPGRRPLVWEWVARADVPARGGDPAPAPDAGAR